MVVVVVVVVVVGGGGVRSSIGGTIISIQGVERNVHHGFTLCATTMWSEGAAAAVISIRIAGHNSPIP